uniref:Variant surface glycoprotein 354 n=1 Tax=Trypanosoma brucei TaxID=5691 RepID=M4SZW0_9TRYP|nr:variant surface glycoprotein 354 [Trypanosoma brucei]
MCSIGARAITVAIALMVCTALASVYAAQADEMDTFFALCDVYEAAKALGTTTYKQQSKREALTNIENYNITASSDEWKQLVTAIKKAGGWPQYKAKPKNAKITYDWTSEFETWSAEHENTKDKNQPWVKQHEALMQATNLNACAQAINITAAEANRLWRKIANRPTVGSSNAEDTLRNSVAKLLCSPLSPRVGDTLTCGDLPSGVTKTKTTACAEANHGKALSDDLICFCSRSTDGPCLHSPGTKEVITNNLADGILKELTGNCPRGAAAVAADTRLEISLTQLQARIAQQTRTATKVITGKTRAGNCNGAASSCLEYSQYDASGKSGFWSIPWVANVAQALTAYKAIKDKENNDVKALELIKNLETATQAELARQASLERAQEATYKAGPKQNQEIQHTAEQMCNKVTETDAKVCNATEICHFVESNKKGKKCTLKKDGKAKLEKDSQETGGKDGKTDCSSHQDQKSCEKENDVLPASAPRKCGWITFTDKEGKLPKPECRSSSLLLNKQFALSVFSAFAAFLF